MVRLAINFHTDEAGRPAGTLQAGDATEECFEDWLDLLRLLERCVGDAHRNIHDHRPVVDITDSRKSHPVASGRDDPTDSHDQHDLPIQLANKEPE